MKFYIAITDNNWFQYLSSIHPDEITSGSYGGRTLQRRADMDGDSRVPAGRLRKGLFEVMLEKEKDDFKKISFLVF
jgi:hypothetical protein